MSLTMIGKDEAEHLLLLVLFAEDAVVVIELVELLGQLIAVVGNAARTVVLAGLGHGGTIAVELLYQFGRFSASVHRESGR